MTATVLLRTGTAAVTRLVALPLALGGLLIAVGGNLHPRETGATLRETLAEMLGSPAWNVSHLLILAGLVVSVAGFVLARRAHAFGRMVDRWLTVAAVCWGLASIELVPHLLAVRDLDALQHHHDTPILETHLWLAVVATPLIGLSTIALAIAVARSARTVSSWVLAAIATVGGVAYAAASPLIRFVGNPELSVLFAGQALIAVWVLGTAVRLAVRPTVPSANLVLVAASGCGDEQRRDLGEEDTRAALQERVAQVVENEGLALDGNLECSADIGADSAVTSTCTGTTTSAAAIVASFTGTADVDAETCTARLVVEVDGEVVLDEPDADCFAVSQ